MVTIFSYHCNCRRLHIGFCQIQWLIHASTLQYKYSLDFHPGTFQFQIHGGHCPIQYFQYNWPWPLVDLCTKNSCFLGHLWRSNMMNILEKLLNTTLVFSKTFWPVLILTTIEKNYIFTRGNMRKWRQSVVRGADTHEGYYSVRFLWLWSFMVSKAFITHKVTLQNLKWSQS